MNHIVFCINKNWIKQCKALIASIVYFNGNDFTFHIIGKDFLQSDIESIKQTVQDINVVYHEVTQDYDERFIIRRDDYVTIETYYRFFIADLLSKEIDRVLYLDCDIICTGNIKDLFSEDLGLNVFGMVGDVYYDDVRPYNRLNFEKMYNYYNAGVILINMDLYRKENYMQKLINYVSENPERCIFHDQDAINYILRGKIKKLDWSYNIQRKFWYVPYWLDLKRLPRKCYGFDCIKRENWKDIFNSVNNPKLVHFTEKEKPWKVDCSVPYTKVWKYFFYNYAGGSEKDLEKTYVSPLGKIKRLIKKLFYKEQKNENLFPMEFYNQEVLLLEKITR